MKETVQVVPVYSYLKVSQRQGRKTVKLGTMQTIEGESEADSIKRARVKFKLGEDT